jgi:hypothetical protein
MCIGLAGGYYKPITTVAPGQDTTKDMLKYICNRCGIHNDKVCNCCKIRTITKIEVQN